MRQQVSHYKKNSLKYIWSKKMLMYFLILISVNLSACGFPIKPRIGMYPILGGSLQIVASVLVYAIPISAFICFFMGIEKYFKNCKYYNILWMIISLIFSNLLLLLIGISPEQNQLGAYIIGLLTFSLFILAPTLGSSVYKNRKKRNNPD